MSAEEPQVRDNPEVAKKSTPQEWPPPQKLEATALSVLPNSKIPKVDLEKFYDYCKENPQAKEAVDTVIKAFSKPPHTIEEFVANCAMYPLPTDLASFNGFLDYYATEIRENQAAEQVNGIQKQEKQTQAEVVQNQSETAQDK